MPSDRPRDPLPVGPAFANLSRPPDLLFGRFRLQRDARRLLAGAEVIALPPEAFNLLELLALRKGDAASKDEIMLAVWADAEADYLLAQTIVALRESLDAPGATLIETVPRRGYRLAIPVTEVHAMEPPPPPPPRTPWFDPRGESAARSWTLTAVALAGAVAVGVLMPRRSPDSGVITFADLSVTPVTETGDVGSSAMSRDGRVVAYVRRGSDGDSIWVRRLTTGAELEVVPGGVWPLVHVTVSPDSDWVYFVSAPTGGPSALWRVESQGGAPVKVLDDLASPAAVSPDGRRLAFVRWFPARGVRALLVAGTDGRGVRELFSQRMPEVIVDGGLDWSPDGREVAVIVNASAGGSQARVVGVNAESGEARTIAARPLWSAVAVQWHCEGRSLLVADGQLWHVPLPQGTPEQLTREPLSYRSPSAGDGCGHFTAVEERQTSAIWVAPDGNLQVATKLLEEPGHNHGLAWLPDGRLVYESTQSGNVDLWIADAQGGAAPRQLTTDPAIDAFPAVTPDGRFVVFMSTRAGGATIWRTALDGSESRQLSAAGAHYAPAISPDGRSIVYHSADAALSWVLMRMSVDGGSATRLADRPATFPVFSPDGTLIASNYLRQGAAPGDWSIALLRAADGVPMRILDVPGPPTRRLAWMADGSGLMASNPDRHVLRIPVDGSEPTIAIDAPEGESVLAVSASRAGPRIAFVRGASPSNAVLFTPAGR
jgi:Tol biopolymer transport system component/DNA-binding winged helix-turn-helix (wHTH) protein